MRRRGSDSRGRRGAQWERSERASTCFDLVSCPSSTHVPIYRRTTCERIGVARRQ